LNSSLSRDFELLSSAILNFLAIPEIPLAPLLASLFLKLSRSYCSEEFAATPSSFAGAALAG